MSALEAGFAPARLAVLDSVLKARYLDSGLLPGLDLTIWRRGELAHSLRSGVMDLERGTPLREDAIFRIHSMTKPIIAVALLILMEEARLDLGDEVAKFIPEWRGLRVLAGGSPRAWQTVPPNQPMRIIDLARHSSGLIGGNDTPLGRHYRDMNIGGADTEGGLDAFVEQIAALPLGFQPGQSFYYGLSTTALGVVVERAAGMKLGAFLRTRIFAPLGMADTDFHCPPAKAVRLAVQYSVGADGRLAPSVHSHDWLAPPALESGVGGLVSTMADYLRFSRMLLGRGTLDGVQILSPKSVALLSLNLLPGGQDIADFAPPGAVAADPGFGISICVATTINPARRLMPSSLGDITWAGAACTYFVVDPREQMAVIAMAQVHWPPFFGELERTIYTLVYSAFAQSLA